MHKSIHNIGCLEVEVFTTPRKTDIECFDISGSGSAECFGILRSTSVECFNVSEVILAECFALKENVFPSAFLLCSVNKDSFIRFKENLLAWYGADNKEGVVKYNTIVASGKWSLEEVEIEELL